jgi:flagellar biosynthesis protein FlhF
MKLHTYRASTEADAFRQVRAELGPDAIVISTRPVRRGGLRGLLGRGQEVEVTAAIDPLADSRPAPLPAPLPAGRPSRARQEYAEIRATLDEMTTMLGRLSQAGAGSALGQIHEGLRDAHRRLIAQEVRPALADNLIAAIQEELSPRALDDRGTVLDCLHRHIVRLLPAPEPVTLTPGLPVMLFLIGPTGVGKTTTIAKLAARFALLERYRVALATVDTFRIAATEQLRVYAEILGLPLEVAYTAADLAAVAQRNRAADIILVDTPGRSQHDAGHIQELHAYLHAAPRRLVYLTIDAGVRAGDMVDIARCFAPDQLDGLIVTKLDETTQYGSLLNLVEHTRRPLAYLATGQEVPDDLEEATSRRVAQLILGGAL